MFSNWKITPEIQENGQSGLVNMENLNEKLKLLNYQNELFSKLNLKPIHKLYFMIQKNPGEQFFIFVSIAAWLIRKTGKDFEQPQEYDDPNITIGTILNFVREFDTIDFAPNKLKQGFGEYVVDILDKLADNALEYINFKFESFKPPEFKEEEDDILEDESELFLEQVEEDMLAYYSDNSDNESAFKFNDLATKQQKQKNVIQIDNNFVNEEAWKMELERVLPKLKVTISNISGRDWRLHNEQMKQHRSNINTKLASTKIQLDKLHRNISETLEKVSIREKYLNRELDSQLNEYRKVQDQLIQSKEQYNSLSGGVTERTRELAVLTDRLENVKQEMEERGSSMTDGTPVVNIKKAIVKIKSELTAMDIRIGVLECYLLQSKVRQNKLLEDDLNQFVY